MGAGKTKAHEAYNVAPATGVFVSVGHEPDGPATNTVDNDTGALVAGKKWHNPESALEIEPNETPKDNDPPTDQTPLESGLEAAPPVATPGLDDTWHSDEPLTPLPDAPSALEPIPEPVLLSGGDFENATISLTTYDTAAGQVDTLYGWVHPDAEAKILHAIIGPDQLVEVTEPATVTGPIPADIDNDFHKELLTAVKSVKHHTNGGTEIPAHTHQRLADLEALRDTLTTSDDPTVAAMLAHYQPALDAAIATAKGTGTPDAIGTLTQFETEHETTVTKLVPAPQLDATGPDLVAKPQPATRPDITAVAGGPKTLTGRIAAGAGQEYEIDLGGGFTARYRPHANADSGEPGAVEAAKGMQGLLEIQAPPGAGHHHDLVGRLAQLNLNNSPLAAAEAEHTYLLRNAWAQGIDQTPAVRDAIDTGHTLAASYAELIASERAHQAAGLNQADMVAWAKRIRLEADTATTGMRTDILREAVAAELGYPNAAAMTSTAGYDPQPTRQGASYSWNRFDVDPTTAPKAWANRKLVHNVSGNNLPQILASGGVLAATEHRRFIGTKAGVGMSESADVNTGGSRAVFLRVRPASSSTSGQWLEWNNPAPLLARSDWYAYNGDQYGKFTNGTNQTRNPDTLATHTAKNNEVMFRDGIDLFGPHGPDRIHLGTKAAAAKAIADLEAAGRTHIRDKPLADVIVA